MRRFILTFIAIISICATYAQTLDECRQLAREHYPEIRQYDLVNATEQYNLSNAARAWIPQIKLSAQASYQSATPTYPDAFRAFISANGIEMDGIHKDQYKNAIQSADEVGLQLCSRDYGTNIHTRVCDDDISVNRSRERGRHNGGTAGLPGASRKNNLCQNDTLLCDFVHRIDINTAFGPIPA